MKYNPATRALTGAILELIKGEKLMLHHFMNVTIDNNL